MSGHRKMSMKQQGFYFDLWHQAADANGWDRKDGVRRHGEISRALVAVFGELRRGRRFRDFDDDDFAVVKAHFEMLARHLGFDPGILRLELLEDRQRRLRYLVEMFKAKYGVRQYQTIMAERFDSLLFEELSFEQIEQLLFTLNARLHKYKTHQGKTNPTPSEVPCTTK